MHRFLRPRLREIVVVVIVAGLLGCGEHARRAANETAQTTVAKFSSPASGETADKQVAVRFVNFQPAAATERRIIFEAELNLVVKSVADTEGEITRLLKEVDGYIAEANVDRTQGRELTGHWKVRIPVAKFESFLENVSKFGVPETRRQTAQDVTQEFVDLEAQIANKKKLEERIVALLKDSSGKIKDVIEVERELARVRTEIEQMEGRLRYLTNRTDFTTIAISAREQENYVPPAAPTFIARIAQAWNTSLITLRNFGQQITIVAVSAFPWLGIVGVVIVPTSLYLRKRKAAIRKPAAT